MGTGAESEPGSRTPFAVVAALALAFSVAAVLLALVTLALASRHERNARRVGAAILAQDLASRIAACSDPDRSDLPGRPNRTLPPSSRSVPSLFPGRQGYRSTDVDWQDEAFRCAEFRPLVPLSVQVRWVQVPAPGGFAQAGQVRVSIYQDDGSTDDVVMTGVACTEAQCAVAPRATMESAR